MAATSAAPAEVLVGDAYREILLRLPADRPELLYRFTVVSPTWRQILIDPVFLRCYREFHGLQHLIGYVHDGRDGPSSVVAGFVTTAHTTFRPRLPKDGEDLHVLDSRHGRVIFEKFGKGWIEESTLIVWDPVRDRHQELRKPDAFAKEEFVHTAAVLCDAPECNHHDCNGGPFRVVFVGLSEEKGSWSTSVFNYTSASGSWIASPAAAAPIADDEDWGFPMPAPTTLVGASTLYFRSFGRPLRYQFADNVEEQLAYIDVPPYDTQDQEARGSVLMPAADGKLSFAAMYADMSIRFWETKVLADGSVDWVYIGQKVLPEIPVPAVLLIGSTASLLFFRTKDDGVIRIDVGSGRFEELPRPATRISGLVPFMRFRIP